MSIRDWFKRSSGHVVQRVTLEDFNIGAPTAAGPAVTAESALRSPATLASVRLISESMALIPAHVYSTDTDGQRERDTNSRAAQLLAGFANEWTPWNDLVVALTFDAVMHPKGGLARVTKVRDEIREVIRLDPRCWSLEYDRATGEPKYQISLESGKRETLTWRDVLHLDAPGNGPGRQIGVLDQCREAIALDLVMAEAQAKRFKNGINVSGFLKVPVLQNKDERKAALDFISKWRNAGEKAGGAYALEPGFDWVDAGAMSSTDAQFLELRRFVVEEIGRSLRCPPLLIGDYSRAVWRNLEDASQVLVTYTLAPWLVKWAGALTRAFIPESDRARLHIEHVTDALVKTNLQQRFAAYRQACGGAFLLPNEVRRLDNRPPVAGGDELVRQAGQEGATPSNENDQDNKNNDDPQSDRDA